jgi:hypothetical protein
MAKHSILGVGVTTVLTAGFVAAAFLAVRHRDRLVADYLASRTTRVSDEGLTSHLRRLADLGPEGIPALVASLASGRPAEREAAITVLDEVVAGAEPLQLQRLSRELADVADSLAERPREAAVRWSNRVVIAQYRSGRRDSTVLADCRRIQEAGPREPSPVPVIASGADVELPVATQPDEPDSAVGQTADTEGGERDPIDGTQLAAEFPEHAVASSSRDEVSTSPEETPVSDEPGRLPALAAGQSETMPQPVAQPEDPRELAGKQQGPAVPTAAATALAGEASAEHDIGPSTPLGKAAASPAPAPGIVLTELQRRPEGLGDRDLLTLLHHDDAAVSGWAENELRRRGISSEQVSLGRLITHPDPGVRARLARGLPRMPKVDRVVWLLELTHDSHPAVRLAALSSIAGFPDKQLESRVREMIETDPDEGVRRRAEWLFGLGKDAGFAITASGTEQPTTAPPPSALPAGAEVIEAGRGPALIEAQRPAPLTPPVAPAVEVTSPLPRIPGAAASVGEQPAPPPGRSAINDNGWQPARSAADHSGPSVERAGYAETTSTATDAKKAEKTKKADALPASIRRWRSSEKD